MNSLRRKIPFFQLIGGKQKKSIDSYLDEDAIIDCSKVTEIVVLGQGKEEVVFSNNFIYEDIINLNRYEFNYDRSPSMLVMNYFNKQISLDDMYEKEKEIIKILVNSSNSYRVFAKNALDYERILRLESI